MAVKNIYNAKEKEKSLYGSSGAANGSRTAFAGTQNAPQSNVWNAEQSTPYSQSNPLKQKRQREKSPSELGEEAVRTMLDDDAVEERQRQTVPSSTAQYNSGSAGTKAAGNRKTAQYGDTAVQFGEPASYSSLSAVKPAARNQKATPYGGAATAPYSSPAAAEPAIQKLEKTPSERGIEVVRAMLEDEGLLEPPGPEGNEAPAGRTFTTGVSRSDIIGPAANAGEDAGPTPATPEEVMLAAAPDFAAAGMDTSVLQAGLTLADKIEQLTPDRVNQLALDWLPSLSAPDLYDPGLAAAANQFGFALADKIEQFTPEKANSHALDWLDLMSMSNSDYPGLPMFANPVSPLLKNGTRPIWSNTNLVADTQAPEIEIQDVERNPQNNRAESESEALPNEDKSDTVKEWWEKPGASEPIDPDDPTYQAMNATLTDNQRAAGLSVVKINGEYYVDVTIMINTRLQEVEPDFRNHLIDFQDPDFYLQGPTWANTAWFVSQVNDNGPWDIKLEKPWLQQFGNILQLKRMSETIAYNGQVVTPEELGNLTYGYLGSAMGWPEDVLCLGGGVVNQKNLAAEDAKEVEGKILQLITRLKFLNPSLYFDGSYGDEENDILFIKKGVELYESVH